MESFRADDLTQEIMSLYESSFSVIEKIPYVNIRRTLGKGGELISFHDEGRFVGFSFVFRDADRVFLVYLAVCPDLRSKGYGGRILSSVRDTFNGCDIFLPMESLDPGADDLDTRKRRYDFYIRNGCRDSGFTCVSDDYPFTIMVLQGNVTKDEADSLITEYEDIHNGRRP